MKVIGAKPEEMKYWMEFKTVDGKEYRREIAVVITDWKECPPTHAVGEESEHHGKRG